MPVFDSNCLYIIQCLALVFLVAPCVLFAGGMLICLLAWCGLRITRALHLRLLGLAALLAAAYTAGLCAGKATAHLDEDAEPKIYMDHTHGGED